MPAGKKIAKLNRKSAVPSGRKCPKCGSAMIKGSCTKCNYSSKTAYKNRREAKEFTFAGD